MLDYQHLICNFQIKIFEFQATVKDFQMKMESFGSDHKIEINSSRGPKHISE